MVHFANPSLRQPRLPQILTIDNRYIWGSGELNTPLHLINFRCLQYLTNFFHVAQTIDVDIGPDTPRTRKDDKHLSAEEAGEKITHLTPEQKQRLSELLMEKGVEVATTDAP